MKSCPYCMAEIPEAAQKCQHCGEWVVPGHRNGEPAPPDAPAGVLGDLFGDREVSSELGRSVNSYVNYKMWSGIIGGVLALIMMIVFLSSMASHGRPPGFGP